MAKSLYSISARCTVFLSTLSALVVMILNKETVHLNNVTVEAKYTDWPSFKFFVLANAIITTYSFLVLLLPSGSLLWPFVAAVDLVMTNLFSAVIAACVIQTNIMKRGSVHVAGWSPYCNALLSGFCNHVIGALAVCCIGALAHFVLTLYTLQVVIDPLLIKLHSGG